MKKTTKILLLFVLGLPMGWMVAEFIRGRSTEPLPIPSGPTIEQVQTMASLVTQRIEIADVRETQIQGYTGGVKACLIIKGDLLMGTDLTKVKLVSVDRNSRKLVVMLHQPRGISPRVDHERTRLFAITDSGLWQVTPGDRLVNTVLLNRAYGDAQQMIADACIDPVLVARSRERTEWLLGAFFKNLGDWDLQIQWTD